MKEKWLRITALGLTLSCCAGLAACSSGGGKAATAPTAAPVQTSSGGAAEDKDFTPITLKLANQNNSEHLESLADYEIAEKIEAATEGRVKVDVYCDNALGDYTSVFQEVMVGTIDMAHTTSVETYDSRMTASMLPYLASGYDELKVAYAPDNYLYQQVYEAGQSLGIHVFGFFCEGFNGVGTTKELAAPGDPNSDKGVMLRTPMLDVYSLSAQALGFRTSSMPYSDTYTALQTSVVDGWAGGPAAANYVSFRDVIKYFYDYHQCQEATSVYMNEETFQSLLPEDQEAITKIIQDICAASIDNAKAYDDEYKQQLRDAGITVVEFSDEELSAFAEKVRGEVWPQLATTLGQEFLDNVEASLKG